MTPRENDHSIDELDSSLKAYARAGQDQSAVQRLSLREIVREASSNAKVLEKELKGIQRRLGTPVERTGDVERASVIGHQLTNLMCLAVLMQGIAAKTRECSPRASQPIVLPPDTESAANG
jgi:hypothetical protein